MTERMKPCPFCGSADVFMHHNDIYGIRVSYHVFCDLCDARGSSENTSDKALASWNGAHKGDEP